MSSFAHGRPVASAAIALSAALACAGVAFAGGTPVLSGSYGWEDGTGTILGSFGNLSDAVNVTAEAGVQPNNGTRMLRVTESPTSGTPQAYIAYIENLQDGDIITASFFGFDQTPGTDPSLRIWGHYAESGDVGSFSGSAGGNNTYTDGNGWGQVEHTWVFDSAGGTRDALVIEARLYSPNCDGEGCGQDFYIDDIQVDIFCAANPALTITFPDDTVIDNPSAPGPECDDPKGGECETPDFASGYGWEDGTGTVFEITNNAAAENITSDDGPVHSGNHALRVTQSDPSGTPQAWVAFIENLEDGDIVSASALVFDTTPGQAAGGYPSYRIWGHYAISGDPTSAAGTANGNNTYSNGDPENPWVELSHEWTFDSNGGQRDALMIEIRLYTSEPTEFFVDDLSVNVCSKNANVEITFPDSVEPPPPPPDPCDVSDLETPALVGDYGWEDGKATIFSAFTGGADNLAAANVGPTDDVSPANGDSMLMLTEAPHAGTPQVSIAFIEGLEHGDTVLASFKAWDETPGASPSVRIWAHYALSGDPESFAGSAGGNETFSAGTGWDTLCNAWLFDAGTQFPPRDALMIEVRLYSEGDCEECSTDYFIDDIDIQVFSDNPNVTITFPDGTVIGDPGQPGACTADVDQSQEIDHFDLFAVNGAWNTADTSADVNSDGNVDGADLGIVLASLGPCAQFLSPLPGDALLIVEQSPAKGGVDQVDLFVELGPDDALVNVYDATVTSTLGFEGGSFITIGDDMPNFDITEDFNFDASEFNSGVSMGENAGWYNFDPINNLGLAGQYLDNRVLIARLYVDPATAFDAQLSVTYEDADGRARQVMLTPEPGTPTCPADLTGDDNVGVPDLLQLLSCWGAVSPGCEGADLTSDGSVGVPDLLGLLSQWGACR